MNTLTAAAISVFLFVGGAAGLGSAWAGPGGSWGERAPGGGMNMEGVRGMTNAAGARVPMLKDHKSGPFTAASREEAEVICARVAAKNNKNLCSAREAGGFTPKAGNWYCVCQ